MPISTIRSRLFAAVYDRMLRQTESAGLREQRHKLLSQAHGVTLEIGAGTGLNLEHYPAGVTQLTLSEPDEYMARKLRQHCQTGTRTAKVVVAPGEALPFAEDSFDTVVSTLVLCTAPDPERTLGEITRVLKPGGRLLFMEHVRSDDRGRATWQDRFNPLWSSTLGNGCNCNRRTLDSIGGSGLAVEHVEDGEIPKAPPIVRPLIIGSARG